MRIAVLLLQALTMTLALALAGSALAVSGTNGGIHATDNDALTAATVPSIEILSTQTHLAGSCSGSPFDLNTNINVDTRASADVRLSTPAVGTIEEFTDETGTNIGPYNGIYPTFHILGFGGGLAPHTSVQLVITTYTGPALTGRSSYISTVVFDCTSGVISGLANSTTDVLPPVPTLSDAMLIAMACMLAAAGGVALRPSTVASRRNRPPLR